MGGGEGSRRANSTPLNFNVVPPTQNRENRWQANVQPNRATSTSASTQCFKCGEVGHSMTNCRKGDRYDNGLFVDKEKYVDNNLVDTEQGLTYDEKKGRGAVCLGR